MILGKDDKLKYEVKYLQDNLNTVKFLVSFWRYNGMSAKTKKSDSTDVEIHHKIDARGLYCPIPVYKTRQAVLEAKPDEVVEILADDPAAEEDISRWAKRTGNTVLAFEQCDDYIRFLIQKTNG
jgi:tRNA 2-thiouridine synthesizing protein A